jgi:CHRD domain
MLLNLPVTRLPQACCVAAALCAIAAPTSADDSRDHFRRGERIEARLKGFAEVPSVSSAASGRFKARIDSASHTLSYELSFSGLEGDVRQAHIHFGQHGVNGGIMVWLCQTAAFNPSPVASTPLCPQSGTVSGTITAADVIGPSGQGIGATEFAEMVKAISAGVAYANVHSSKFTGGEIRGQLFDDD